MAKMFYSAVEAAKKLGKKEDDLKALVRAGKLREFRDADTFNYKVDDVDALAAASGDAAGSGAGASASGEIILEPAEDSGVELAGSGGDVLSLEETEVEDVLGKVEEPSVIKANIKEFDAFLEKKKVYAV